MMNAKVKQALESIVQREKAIERAETQNQPQEKGCETNHEADNTLQTAKACSLPSIRHHGVRIKLLRTRASWK
jgi:hypothetical protein